MAPQDASFDLGRSGRAAPKRSQLPTGSNTALGHRLINLSLSLTATSLMAAREFSAFLSCCDASELLELIEEALDRVSLPKDPSAERETVFSIALGRYVGPGSTVVGKRPGSMAVIGLVGQEGRTFAEIVQERQSLRAVGSCPGDKPSLMGRLSASTTAWIFVVKPPRDRPIALSLVGFAFFFWAQRHADEPGHGNSRSSRYRRHKPRPSLPADDPKSRRSSIGRCRSDSSIARCR